DRTGSFATPLIQAECFQAECYVRPSVRPVQPRLTGNGSFLAEADGPPGTPVSVGVATPKPAGHRSPLRRMTPNEVPSSEPGCRLPSTYTRNVKRYVTHRPGAKLCKVALRDGPPSWFEIRRYAALLTMRADLGMGGRRLRADRRRNAKTATIA